jgi:subtilisin family serine protease
MRLVEDRQASGSATHAVSSGADLQQGGGQTTGSSAGLAEAHRAALAVTQLDQLMSMGEGSARVRIGLIDGPVASDDPDIDRAKIIRSSVHAGHCSHPTGTACTHGTVIARMLSASRQSEYPGICPGCEVFVRPIFSEGGTPMDLPSTSPENLGTAILESVRNGARVLNLSLGVRMPSRRGENMLREALDYTFSAGAIAVTAAGNQGSVGGSLLTRHPATLPVAACDLSGRPMSMSNLGGSVGRRGLCAPGEGVSSVLGGSTPFRGTSAAVPFVTGTIALLWSAFPWSSRQDILHAVRPGSVSRFVPSTLDAWSAYQALAKSICRTRLS